MTHDGQGPTEEQSTPQTKPPVIAHPPQMPVAPNTIDRIIPTSNPSALIGYYVGLFSIMPVAGLVMGPAGIWLGAKGLRAVRETPGLPGKGHAITAIVGGILGCLVNYGIGGIILLAFLNRTPGTPQ